MNRVIALILGGGRGTRLFPLTQMRSKPAVPIGGKYRLIDVSISNCLHADLRRIFVLTQFNSASLNRHISETYRLDTFSRGFVEILAAEQTPDNPHWYQGTADAVRQAARHFSRHDADYYLILSGDHVYRMDYRDLIEEHVERRSDVTIAAQQVRPEEASSMGIFRFDRGGQIVGFEEKPDAARLAEIGSSIPPGSRFLAEAPDKPFVASMGIYLFSRDVLIELLEQHDSVDFGHQIIPAAISERLVNAYLFRGYWADVGTVASFYEANIMLTRPRAPFNFYDPRRPIYTHPRFLPGSRFNACTVNESIVAEGCYLDHAAIENSVVGIRAHVYHGSRVTRSVLLGADYYQLDDEAPPQGAAPPLGIGRDSVLDRVIVDKNACIGDEVRLTNEAGVQHADGRGYYIRSGIIVVPRGGVIESGTVV
jgi:glucose-1-phosphate adenylyltransferase